MLEQFRKFEIQNVNYVTGGKITVTGSEVGGDLDIKATTKGGILNAAIGKGNTVQTNVG